MQYINVQYSEISEILKLYLKNSFDTQNQINSVKINSVISEILDNLSDCSLAAFYSILTLVLKFLNSNTYSSYYISDQISTSLKFEKIIFQEILFVSKKTQREIKIFEEKLHPSLVKGKGKSKEGISIFNIFNKCITNQGKKLMKNIFQFPLRNEDKLTMRLECIEDFYNLKNYTVIKFVINELRNIRDIEKNLFELKKFLINFKIWNGIYYTFESVIKIFEIFNKEIFFKENFNQNQKNQNLKKFKLLHIIYSRINKENIIKVYDFLNNCLDVTKNEIRPKIKIGVNEDLDMLRKEYNSLDEVLSKYAIEYSQCIPKESFMDKFMYVFLPQLGYMFAVEKCEKYHKFMKKVNLLLEQGKVEEVEVEGIRISLKLKKNENDENFNKNNFQLNLNQNENENFVNNFSKKKKIKNKKINEMIIEEEMIEESEDEESQNFNNEEEGVLLEKLEIQENEENNDQDLNDNFENIELQNYEETFILQQIIFKDMKISFQFHSDEMIYFKNDTTSILDNQYGDLSARITDIENAIFREISKQILEFEKDILLTDEFIANLDCFLHFFIISEKLGLTKPIFHSTNRNHNHNQFPNPTQNMIIQLSQSDEESSNSNLKIQFEEGRNIITELMVERKYIKNSFDCKGKNIFIISGNISSGKSVFLRQIGMSVYLSQIGSFVPAKNFSLSLFDKILTNIEILESSLDHLSGFTIELKEIKAILDQLNMKIGSEEENLFSEHEVEYDLNSKANLKTLVILDDPYKRTSIHNKNCLLAGTITYLNSLIKNGNKNLKIFISTSIETRNFLLENGVIDHSITSLYEMKTEIISEQINVNKKNSHVITGNNFNENYLSENFDNLFVNLFEIKEISNFNFKKSLNNETSRMNMNLFLAKENGLDNQIFSRALDISNIIHSEKKMVPDLYKISKIVERFKINKELIKINSELVNEELLDRLNCLLNDD
jgi:DNA mismatch repair ATPase MutS